MRTYWDACFKLPDFNVSWNLDTIGSPRYESFTKFLNLVKEDRIADKNTITYENYKIDLVYFGYYSTPDELNAYIDFMTNNYSNDCFNGHAAFAMYMVYIGTTMTGDISKKNNADQFIFEFDVNPWQSICTLLDISILHGHYNLFKFLSNCLIEYSNYIQGLITEKSKFEYDELNADHDLIFEDIKNNKLFENCRDIIIPV